MQPAARSILHVRECGQRLQCANLAGQLLAGPQCRPLQLKLRTGLRRVRQGHFDHKIFVVAAQQLPSICALPFRQQLPASQRAGPAVHNIAVHHHSIRPPRIHICQHTLQCRQHTMNIGHHCDFHCAHYKCGHVKI